MSQRSEIFSLRNVFMMALLLTVFYGAYSYNALKSNVTRSSITAQNYKVEAEQFNLQLKASLKSRASCMKDLKQLRNNMWELKSKISDAETEVNKQKHDAESKLIGLKKELEICKSQFDSLQKELVKLKEDDRAKNAKSKEEEEEKEKKVKTLNTEHEIAMSKLRDEIENLKKENEKLKSDLSAAKGGVHPVESASKSQPKRRSPDDEPARQMMPPGAKKLGRPKDEPNAQEPERAVDGKNNLNLKNQAADPALKQPDLLNSEKRMNKREDEKVADKEKDTKVEKQHLENAQPRPRQDDIGRPMIGGQAGDDNLKKAPRHQPQLDNQDSVGMQNGAAKVLKKADRGEDNKEKALAFHPPDDEKKEDKAVEETRPRKSAQAMEQIRRGRDMAAAAGAKADKEEQQVAMPLPHVAAKRNKEPNQLPLPERDGAGEKDRPKLKDEDDNDSNAGVQIDY